jgi:hypothetical protein
MSLASNVEGSHGERPKADLTASANRELALRVLSFYITGIEAKATQLIDGDGAI